MKGSLKFFILFMVRLQWKELLCCPLFHVKEYNNFIQSYLKALLYFLRILAFMYFYLGEWGISGHLDILSVVFDKYFDGIGENWKLNYTTEIHSFTLLKKVYADI